MKVNGIKHRPCQQSSLIHHHHNRKRTTMLSHTRLKLCHLFLPVFLLLSLSSFATLIHASCHQLDQSSLLSFYHNISSPPSSPLNWSTAVYCCSWEGITCGTNGRVTSLWLPFRGLRGTLSPALGNLTALSQLNLSYNSLSGSFPHGFFSSFISIQIADLSFNRLVGPLFDELPVSMQTLDLSGNQLNGTIDSSFFHYATSLASFDISNNSFDGFIPSSICVTSPSVKLLDFSTNNFSGQIPQGFKECSQLEVFRAGFNNLSGQLPTDIYNAVQLQEISLPVNTLVGTIDDAIVNLTNLRVLDLYDNQLNGVIPIDIGKLANLEQLQLHINNMTGNLPTSLMNCTKLIMLILRVNNFFGELSSLDFSQLTQLSIIDLGNNNFHGSLPVSLFSCKSVTAIRLSTNQLNGQIPPEAVALQSLSFLSVSLNNLTNITGAMQNLKGCRNLSTLIVSNNFYNEAFPDDASIGDSGGFQNLQLLAIGACLLTGQVPTWLAKLVKLEVLDLSYNQITGSIPGWLGGLPNLFFLNLSFNRLGGYFPIELTQLPALQSEEGSPLINRTYVELPVLVSPTMISNQQYNQLTFLPPAIILGNNEISGNIPIEIGQLKGIHELDLSMNSFSCIIPAQLSNLVNLETLDLEGNHLSGEIPTSLESLHFLSMFNVSYNNLTGAIPTGGQFNTFSESSYKGNPLLCGSVLGQPCSTQPHSTPTSAPKRILKKNIIIALVLGVCFGVGFPMTVLALWILFKRRTLPRGDPDNVGMTNYNSEIYTERIKDPSLVVVFPSNTDIINNLTIYEILKATDNFDQANIIGCGGFGLVYKATLENGTRLAVKKLSGDMGVLEREFKAEVDALSTAQHKNLVSLKGYCVHDGCRILMYAYMENGSLDHWLHEKSDGPAQLDWSTRLKIAQGASCGLAYMHQICEPPIIHRDITSSNILLDNKFEAHVADFGLSRLILPSKTHVTTDLIGTPGYIPPEYSQPSKATLRGDMYSFGVVMLELLTGKRPTEGLKPNIRSDNLVAWVEQMRSEGKQDEVFDSILRDRGSEEQMGQVLDVACMCVNQNPLRRPTITEVVNFLQNVATVEQPPKC